MATNSKNFRIGKSIEEVMLQRNMESDTLPPVHTSQQLQRTLSRANKSRKQTATSRLSRSSASPLDGLRHSGSAGNMPPPTSGGDTYDNFIMESLMEHCRSLQSRVQVSYSRVSKCVGLSIIFTDDIYLCVCVLLFHFCRTLKRS
jgi:hypothetical protein